MKEENERHGDKPPPKLSNLPQMLPHPPTHLCVCPHNAARVPRPRNAFILFRQHQHQIVTQEHPGKTNPEISKIIGEMWRTLPAEEKEYWVQLGDEEKKSHLERFPDYRYQPRRSSKRNGASSFSSNTPMNESGVCAVCKGLLPGANDKSQQAHQQQQQQQQQQQHTSPASAPGTPVTKSSELSPHPVPQMHHYQPPLPLLQPPTNYQQRSASHPTPGAYIHPYQQQHQLMYQFSPAGNPYQMAPHSMMPQPHKSSAPNLPIYNAELNIQQQRHQSAPEQYNMPEAHREPRGGQRQPPASGATSSNSSISSTVSRSSQGSTFSQTSVGSVSGEYGVYSVNPTVGTKEMLHHQSQVFGGHPNQPTSSPATSNSNVASPNYQPTVPEAHNTPKSPTDQTNRHHSIVSPTQAWHHETGTITHTNNNVTGRSNTSPNNHPTSTATTASTSSVHTPNHSQSLPFLRPHVPFASGLTVLSEEEHQYKRRRTSSYHDPLAHNPQVVSRGERYQSAIALAALKGHQQQALGHSHLTNLYTAVAAENSVSYPGSGDGSVSPVSSVPEVLTIREKVDALAMICEPIGAFYRSNSTDSNASNNSGKSAAARGKFVSVEGDDHEMVQTIANLLKDKLSDNVYSGGLFRQESVGKTPPNLSNSRAVAYWKLGCLHQMIADLALDKHKFAVLAGYTVSLADEFANLSYTPSSHTAHLDDLAYRQLWMTHVSALRGLPSPDYLVYLQADGGLTQGEMTVVELKSSTKMLVIGGNKDMTEKIVDKIMKTVLE